MPLVPVAQPSSTPAAQTTDPLPDARPDARPRHVPQELPAVWARLSPFPPADLAESDAWEAVLGALEHALRLSLNEPEEKAIPETARDVHHVYPISSRTPRGPLQSPAASPPSCTMPRLQDGTVGAAVVALVGMLVEEASPCRATDLFTALATHARALATRGRTGEAALAVSCRVLHRARGLLALGAPLLPDEAPWQRLSLSRSSLVSLGLISFTPSCPSPTSPPASKSPTTPAPSFLSHFATPPSLPPPRLSPARGVPVDPGLGSSPLCPPRFEE